MGTSSNFYTIYGAKLPYPTDEAFKEAEDQLHYKSVPAITDCKLTILMDGMGGQYMIIGKVLFNSGDDRWGYEDGDSFVSIPIEKLPEIEATVRKAFGETLPGFEYMLEGQKFELMTLMHCH